MMETVFTLPNLSWHNQQMTVHRGELAKQQASASHSDFELLQREAQLAAERLAAIGSPDGEMDYFDVNDEVRCYEHRDPNKDHRVKQLGWNIGIMKLGEDGRLYASHFKKCSYETCTAQPMGLYAATLDEFRTQRENGTAEVEQQFVLSVLRCLGQPIA